MATKSNSGRARWFEVDSDGLGEIHSNLPKERLVAELVQNCWDEELATKCMIELVRERSRVLVSVTDDNPEGFRDIRDAYTLFRTTPKRQDATRRGRFNTGEKVVFSQARSAIVESTSGTIVFDRRGRSRKRASRESGTRVTVEFPRWSEAEFIRTIESLRLLIPPARCLTTLNGERIVAPSPRLVHHCTLPTEILRKSEGGPRIVPTARATTATLYPKRRAAAMIYEMGLPVCEIAGTLDVDVAQKIPVSHDRRTVSGAFLREVYAEMLNALQDSDDIGELGADVMKVACQSSRVSAATAAKTFRRLFGERSALQTAIVDHDATVEAVHQGFVAVPPQTFGSDVNTKIRAGGVGTITELFSRKKGRPYEPVSETADPRLPRFARYVRFLAGVAFPGEIFHCEFGNLNGNTAAVNFGGDHVVFDLTHIKPMLDSLVSGEATALILHELCHARGKGHDLVYRSEFETKVGVVLAAAIRDPERFREFDSSTIEQKNF